MKRPARGVRPISLGLDQIRLLLSVALILIQLSIQAHGDEQACNVEAHPSHVNVVDVYSPRRSASPPHGAMGASTLYYFDDDSALESPRLGHALQSAGLTTLRFPGGELADNYDWETHSLERPRAWPGEAADAVGKDARTDYREFLEFARKNAIEDLFFVVNLDGAFRAEGDRQDNIRRYAEKAARWVARVKQSGFKVKYWEIGNEPERSGSLPLTAAEYANALTVFSDMMRAADPSIKIGAAGPNALNKVGFADRLTDAQLTYLRSRGGNSRAVCPSLSVKQCVQKIKRAVPGQATAVPWWHSLTSLAGGHFDFAAIHRYTLVNSQRATQQDGRMVLTARLQRLRKFLESKLKRPVPIALTEWNTPSQKQRPKTEIDHLLQVATQLGNNLVAPVDFMHYWPMRTPVDHFRPILLADGSASRVARLHGLYRDTVSDSAIAEQMPSPGIYLLHANTSDRSGLIAVNLNETTRVLRWHLNKPAGANLKVLRLADNSVGQAIESRCIGQISNREKVYLTLPARSLTSFNVH